MMIDFLQNNSDFNPVMAVLQQLRPDYDLQTLSAQVKRQQEAGYKVIYAKSELDILGVAGFIVSESLSSGKRIYVADLVTNSEHRSSGVGKQLLDWLKNYAKEQGCAAIHLDSGVQRFGAHKFYLREGFYIAAHHFALKVED